MSSIRFNRCEDVFLRLSELQRNQIEIEKMDPISAFYQSIDDLCSEMTLKGVPQEQQWLFDSHGCVGIAKSLGPSENGEIMLTSSEFDENTLTNKPFSSTEGFDCAIRECHGEGLGWKSQRKTHNRLKVGMWFCDKSKVSSGFIGFKQQQQQRQWTTGGSSPFHGGDLNSSSSSSSFSHAMNELSDNSRGWEIPSRGTINLIVGSVNSGMKNERKFSYDMRNYQGSFQGNTLFLTFPLLPPEACRIYATFGQPRVFLKLRIWRGDDGRCFVAKSSLDVRFGSDSASCSEIKKQILLKSNQDARTSSAGLFPTGISPSLLTGGADGVCMVRKHCLNPAKTESLKEELKEFTEAIVQPPPPEQQQQPQPQQQGDITQIQIKVENKKNSLMKIVSSTAGANKGGVSRMICAGSVFSTIIRIALLHCLGKTWSHRKHDPSFVTLELLKSCPLGLGSKLKKIYERSNLPGPTLFQLFQGCSGLPEYFPIDPNRAVDYVEKQALNKSEDRRTQHAVASLFDDIFLVELPGSICRQSLVGDFIIKQILRCCSEDGNENSIIKIVTDSIGMKDFILMNNRDFVYSSIPVTVMDGIHRSGGAGGCYGQTAMMDGSAKMRISAKLSGDGAACLYTPSIFHINNPQGPLMSFKDLCAFGRLFTVLNNSDCGRYLNKICKPRYRFNKNKFQAVGYGGWTTFVKANRLYHELGHLDPNTNTLSRIVFCPSNGVSCVLTITGTHVDRMAKINKKLLMKIFSDSDALSVNGAVSGFETIRPLQAPKLPHYKEWKKFMCSSSLNSCRKTPWFSPQLRNIKKDNLPYRERPFYRSQLKIMMELTNNGCTLSPMFVNPRSSGTGYGVNDRVSIVFKDKSKDFIQLIFHQKNELQQALNNPKAPVIPLFWDRKFKHFRTHRGDYVLVSVHESDFGGEKIPFPVLSVSGSCYTAEEYTRKCRKILQEHADSLSRNLDNIKYLTDKHSKSAMMRTPHGFYPLIGSAFISDTRLTDVTASGLTPTLVVYDDQISGPFVSSGTDPYGDSGSEYPGGVGWNFASGRRQLALIQ